MADDLVFKENTNTGKKIFLCEHGALSVKWVIAIFMGIWILFKTFMPKIRALLINEAINLNLEDGGELLKV